MARVIPARRQKDYDIQTVEVHPGDTILCHISDEMDLDKCRGILHELQETFPNNNVLLVNEWVLKGMTILRNAQPIGHSVDEIISDKPLEEQYPDLFNPTESSLDPGGILW